MLQKKVQQANPHGSQPGDLGHNLVRDEVEAPRPGLKLDDCLMPVQGLASLLPHALPLCKGPNRVRSLPALPAAKRRKRTLPGFPNRVGEGGLSPP